ncbi:MAG TPA: hypothetical protein VGI14_08390 [Casimicrobiaceae bacterium]|jgi:hypothetical protein
MTVDDRVEAALDYALEMTFPASDAFVVTPRASGCIHDASKPTVQPHDGHQEARTDAGQGGSRT